MPLDPLIAFMITLALIFAGLAYVLRMASLEQRGLLGRRRPPCEDKL